MEECNEIIEEVKIVSENKNKCSSCIFYIALFSMFFTINIGIGSYFVYYKYMNHNNENVSKYDYVYQGKNYQYKWKKSNKYRIKIKFLLKSDKKSYKNIDVYNIGYWRKTGILKKKRK